jgi:hypothetical protein
VRQLHTVSVSPSFEPPPLSPQPAMKAIKSVRPTAVSVFVRIWSPLLEAVEPIVV